MLFNIFFKKFFKKNFAKRKNISTFAENSDNEPTALATDFGKPIILSGKSAEDFERRMHEVEKEAEYRRLHPKEKTLEELKKNLSYEEIMLGIYLKNIDLRRKRIENIKKQIEEKSHNTDGKI